MYKLTSLIRYAKMMEDACNDLDIETLLRIDQFSLQGIRNRITNKSLILVLQRTFEIKSERFDEFG